ncbi:MAG: hypothetical protein WEA84_02730 [Rhodovibrionaceae bacterium]
MVRGLPAMGRLVELTRARAEAALGSAPDAAHLAFEFEELRARAGRLRRDFAAAGELRTAFAEVFSALGFAPEETFGDRRALRIVPPGPRRTEGALRSLPPHRDSWGSNLAAQINWWAPVYRLEAANTLLLYPDYWSKPIANSTSRWSLEELYAARQRGEAYPRLPVAEEEPAAAALPCTIAPGDLLCFSGAQLHASALGSSGRTRISFETRTVSLPDLRAGRGAPNVDGHPGLAAYRWFTRLTDDAGLQSVIGEGGTDLPEGGRT